MSKPFKNKLKYDKRLFKEEFPTNKTLMNTFLLFCFLSLSTFIMILCKTYLKFNYML